MVGDYVYLLGEPKHSKFDFDWIGPHQIRQIYENLNIEIEIKTNKFNFIEINSILSNRIQNILLTRITRSSNKFCTRNAQKKS